MAVEGRGGGTAALATLVVFDVDGVNATANAPASVDTFIAESQTFIRF
jgi:hypothetical protein